MANWCVDVPDGILTIDLNKISNCSSGIDRYVRVMPTVGIPFVSKIHITHWPSPRILETSLYTKEPFKIEFSKVFRFGENTEIETPHIKNDSSPIVLRDSRLLPSNVRMTLGSKYDNFFIGEDPIHELMRKRKLPLIGWKKVHRILPDDCFEDIICKLEIPVHAKVVITEDKCRASEARVVSFKNAETGKRERHTCVSSYDVSFEYRENKTVSEPGFVFTNVNKCLPGIHFFRSEEEAVNWI